MTGRGWPFTISVYPAFTRLWDAVGMFAPSASWRLSRRALLAAAAAALALGLMMPMGPLHVAPAAMPHADA